MDSADITSGDIFFGEKDIRCCQLNCDLLKFMLKS